MCTQNARYRNAVTGIPVRILLALICLSTAAVACNIPVFRYALERWTPDNCQIYVFHDGPLTDNDRRVVAELESVAGGERRLANVRLHQHDVRQQLPADIQDVWFDARPLAENHKGQAVYVARSVVGQGKTITVWQGTSEELNRTGVLRSPVRSELAQRLQAGHAVVWLMLKSTDDTRNEATRKMLNSQFERLATSIELPEGIGLPGSELYSEVPLLLKFSVLEIDPSDPKESFLVKLLTGFHPDAVADGEPLIAPVFGRGRALEVIPASKLNPDLIEDLTVFLCGACSCQVKELNPGFDLLLSSDWNTALFGEGTSGPPARIEGSQRADVPVTIPIPTGKKRR
ncbi:MAG: hypothetical protein R3C20_10025 [Planctomycetaceae bacterium]